MIRLFNSLRRTLLLLTLGGIGSCFLVAQPELTSSAWQTEADVRFLASDELAGRKPGTQGHAVAARYLATQYAALGLEKPASLDSYFQEVPFVLRQPAEQAFITFKDSSIEQGDQWLQLRGNAVNQSFPAVFLGHAWQDANEGIDDYAQADLTGKVVIANMGAPGLSNPGEIIQASAQKRRWVAERGGLGLIEIYDMGIPFGFVVRNFQRPQLTLREEGKDDSPGLFHAWITAEGAAPWLTRVKEGKKTTLTLRSSGVLRQASPAPNVVGMLPGADPELKNEYILLTAHYDHVGSGSSALGRPYTSSDSIYNGARDNALGISALLAAARSLSAQPPARSVIFAAFTAEEMGLLGSQYYAEHPLVPLAQIVFNLNADGAGYDDTTSAMVIGWGRTTAQTAIEGAADSLPIALVEDQLPQMQLFNRSDQVSLAKKGVPAAMLSPTIQEFGQEIQAQYHTVTDEVDDLNFAYAHQYAQLFAHLARRIADLPETPTWVEGDPYEAAGKALYGE